MDIAISSKTYSVKFAVTASSTAPDAPTYANVNDDGSIWHDRTIWASPEKPYQWVAIGDGETYAVGTIPVGISPDA